MGQSEGLQGNSYGINTMSGFEIMREQIKNFLEFAKSHSDLLFYVTEIGCGIAGYQYKEVAPLFKGYSKNVILPKNFEQVLVSK